MNEAEDLLNMVGITQKDIAGLVDIIRKSYSLHIGVTLIGLGDIPTKLPDLLCHVKRLTFIVSDNAFNDNPITYSVNSLNDYDHNIYITFTINVKDISEWVQLRHVLFNLFIERGGLIG